MTIKQIQTRIVRQARKIVVMRRKQALWKDLEPELSKLGVIVRSLEKIEKGEEDGKLQRNGKGTKGAVQGNRRKAKSANGRAKAK